MNLKKPYILVATWFGSGLSSKAPGTCGSLAAIPPALILIVFGGIPALIAGIAVITALGFWAANKFDKEQKSHDSKMIVIDEVAGQWIALIPAGLDPVSIVLAFTLFRLFDILKPWPVSHFDKNVKGAAGVMGDDIAAGLLALLCLGGMRYAGLI